MNQITLFFTLLAVSSTLGASSNTDASVQRTQPELQHEDIHDKFGQYALRYVTAEGTVVSERGRLIPTPDKKGLVMVVEGDVSYIGDDGKTYVVEYSADLDGYKVKGGHLPISLRTKPPAVSSQ